MQRILKYMIFCSRTYNVESYEKKYIELFLEPEPSTSEQSELSTKIQLSQQSKTLLTSNEESDEVEATEKNDETEIAVKAHKGTLLYQLI